jgi:uncharacterized protein YqiB (DUF1249 family)
MNKNVYETNFDRLVKLGIIAKDGSVPEPYRRSRSAGYMDLVVERHKDLDYLSGSQGIAVSLTHYFEQNGDLCMDPEMVIVVYPTRKMAEVLTFEQSLPPLYQEVYPEPGKVYPQLQKELNKFLRTWLNNLIAQGHGKLWVLRRE